MIIIKKNNTFLKIKIILMLKSVLYSQMALPSYQEMNKLRQNFIVVFTRQFQISEQKILIQRLKSMNK